MLSGAENYKPVFWAVSRRCSFFWYATDYFFKKSLGKILRAAKEQTRIFHGFTPKYDHVAEC